MNRTWRIILAAFLVLAGAAYGAVAGFGVAVLGVNFLAAHRVETGGEPGPLDPINLLLPGLTAAGSLAGVALAVYLARKLFAPPSQRVACTAGVAGNRSWQIAMAITAFLGCLAFGSLGGCTAGAVAAFGMAEGGANGTGANPAGANVLFPALLAGGVLVGLALGIYIARQILIRRVEVGTTVEEASR